MAPKKRGRPRKDLTLTVPTILRPILPPTILQPTTVTTRLSPQEFPILPPTILQPTTVTTARLSPEEFWRSSYRTLFFGGSDKFFKHFVIPPNSTLIETRASIYNEHVKLGQEYFSRRHSVNLMMDMIDLPPSLPIELDGWARTLKPKVSHATFYVSNLQQTLEFYTEFLGLKFVKGWLVPRDRYLCGAVQLSHDFFLHPTQIFGAVGYDVGNQFGHFTIVTNDVNGKVQRILEKDGIVLDGGFGKVLVKDPNGYTFELIEQEHHSEIISPVMTWVINIDRAIHFYEKALGMKLLRKKVSPELKYTSAFLSFAHDSTNQVVFEFRAYHGVVEYQQGNSNIQYFVLSEDLYEIGEVVYQAVQEFGGSIKRLYSRSEGDRMNSLCFLDPDGLKMVLARSLFLKWMDGVNK